MKGNMDLFTGPGQTASNENVALYNAAKDGNVSALKDALNSGANVNYTHRSSEGCPLPLHESVKMKHGDGVTCTKLLLDSGASLDTMLITNCNTPLHEAAHAGASDACRLLIENHNERRGGGLSSSSSSVLENNNDDDDDVQEDYVSRSNSYGNTPLFSAVRCGSVETVRLLMEHSADVNAVNHLKSTVLHLCAFMAQDVEKKYGDNNVGDEERSSIATDSSRQGIVEPHLQIAAMILACGKFNSIDALDANGHSALHICCQRGCMKLVKLLVDSGASMTIKTTVDMKGRGGRAPADMAIFGGMMKTAELLKDLSNWDKGNICTGQMAKALAQGG